MHLYKQSTFAPRNGRQYQTRKYQYFNIRAPLHIKKYFQLMTGMLISWRSALRHFCGITKSKSREIIDFKLVAEGDCVYDTVPVLRPQIKATLYYLICYCHFQIHETSHILNDFTKWLYVTTALHSGNRCLYVRIVLHPGNKTFMYIQVFSTLFLDQPSYQQAIRFYVPFYCYLCQNIKMYILYPMLQLFCKAHTDSVKQKQDLNLLRTANRRPQKNNHNLISTSYPGS